MVMTLEAQDGDPVKTTEENPLLFELRQFELFKSIVRVMVNGTKFSVSKEIPPSLDDDYGHMGMMKNNGIIEVNTGSIPVEIIVNPSGETPISTSGSPVILLAKAT